jgi:hypothetical protein
LSYYFTNLDFFGFGFSLGEKTSPWNLIVLVYAGLVA